MNIGFKKLSGWKNWTAKILVDQNCKICASAHNGLNDFAKSIGRQLKKLLLIIIYMNVRDYNYP